MSTNMKTSSAQIKTLQEKIAEEQSRNLHMRKMYSIIPSRGRRVIRKNDYDPNYECSRAYWED